MKCRDFKDNGNGLCSALWSNGWAYKMCRRCALFPISLCENCINAGYSGPHLYCKLDSFPHWIPRSKAIMKTTEGTNCKDYKRYEASE